ncbi:hypothetical protein HYX10_02455 [Candidatus Woesearchaeota archaeon]|nr:hypothetical protein [Candidatus Woesearchaeota archaeon]
MTMGKKLSKLWNFIKNPFTTLAIGLVIGLIFSPQLFFIQNSGFLWLSSYSHTDFKQTFRDSYYDESNYTNDGGLIVSIRNSYVLGNSVKTTFEAPDFVDYDCKLLEAKDGESCDNYIIPPQGAFRKVQFDLRIGETSKSRHEFCIETESLTNTLFKNNRNNCIDVTINQNR